MASTRRRVLTPILLTLVVGGSFSRSDPAQATGFVDDAEVELSIRNYYHYRNFLDPVYPQGKAEEWVQAFILKANSGFTPGPVGFAVDVIGQFGIKLDGGRGTSDSFRYVGAEYRFNDERTLVGLWGGRAERYLSPAVPGAGT